MKGLLVILIVAVLAYTKADIGSCTCAAFLRSTEDRNRPDLNSMVYSHDSFIFDPFGGDDASEVCKERCVEEAKIASGGGNLEFITPYGNTVGAMACIMLKKDVQRGEFAVFSKASDGDWEFGLGSDPPYICCRRGRRNVVCP